MSGPYHNDSFHKTLNRSSIIENLFSWILLLFVGLFFCGGVIMHKMEITKKSDDNVIMYDRIQTSFVMEEPKSEPPKPEMKKPRPSPAPRAAEAAPVDLTEKPPIIKEEEIKEEEPQEQPPQEQRQVRQVYGLRRVYSQGLGAGGSSQDAIVGKLGNTLNKDFDTLTASDSDLKGGQGGTAPAAAPVSAASVTKYPRLKSGFRNLKPQYSKEMLANRVEGTVRVRIMIGSDGTVKRIEVLSDIGYDSAEIARAFLMGLQFEPAMRGDSPVSVWIPFSIRFELI
ncbi:MAG: energy transducer TonB [Chitinispirillia bacterium]|nr:energy transducer TonB [Chitinispirillia bacterium]